MTSRKICVVTSTRADYGLLRPLMRAIAAEPSFQLSTVATGTHLSPEFGLTVRAVEADGFTVDERVEMLLSSDTAVGIATSMGLATVGFAGAIDRIAPDLMVVLGDRYEILAVVQAALIARVPIAHVSGGDITEGAIDDAIRHAITKLSHLHFVTNEGSRDRVLQMGEDPEHVVVSGSAGIDDLLAFEPWPRARLEHDLGLRLRKRNLLVTYHPVTLADEPAKPAFGELLAALDALGNEVGLILTLPNADTGGRVIIDMAREFAAARDHVVAHDSLGQERYWSCLKTVDAMIGNSSSGLTEAPAVGIPTVNIGERQRGRLRADSTIDCAATAPAIADAIERALEGGRISPTSPYGDGRATERIMQTLHAIDDWSALVVKTFRTTGSSL